MGQRLNLEIHDHNHKGHWNMPVANAYYHWSGYSESAVEILQDALKAIKEIKEENPLIRAIKVLEATGASLTKEELEKNKDILGDYKNTSEVVSSNDGLIAVSKDGMKETRSLEEGRVEIHLNPYDKIDYVKFKVFWQNDDAEYMRYYGDDATDRKDVKEVVFNFDRIPFDKVDELEEIITNNDQIIIPSRIIFIK